MGTGSVRAVCELEKEGILEWIEETEEQGMVQLTQFAWHRHTYTFVHDFKHLVKSDVTGETKEFQSWEDALNYGMEETLRELEEKLSANSN